MRKETTNRQCRNRRTGPWTAACCWGCPGQSPDTPPCTGGARASSVRAQHSPVCAHAPPARVPWHPAPLPSPPVDSALMVVVVVEAVVAVEEEAVVATGVPHGSRSARWAPSRRHYRGASTPHPPCCFPVLEVLLTSLLFPVFWKTKRETKTNKDEHAGRILCTDVHDHASHTRNTHQWTGGCVVVAVVNELMTNQNSQHVTLTE